MSATAIQAVPKPLTKFEGIATRTRLEGRYDLIPREANDAMARRLEKGIAVHGENNWRSGGEEFRRATICHLMNHLLDYIEHGNENDQNTDAIVTNAAFLCYFEKRSPFIP